MPDALLEFVYARLADDEAETWTLHPYDCEPGCCAPDGWVGARCRYCDAAPVYGGTVEAMTRFAEEHAERVHQRSRALADAAARRRLADTTQRFHDGGEWDAYGAESSYERLILLGLAARDADHPDYRQEWAAEFAELTAPPPPPDPALTMPPSFVLSRLAPSLGPRVDLTPGVFKIMNCN